MVGARAVYGMFVLGQGNSRFVPSVEFSAAFFGEDSLLFIPLRVWFVSNQPVFYTTLRGTVAVAVGVARLKLCSPFVPTGTSKRRPSRPLLHESKDCTPPLLGEILYG